MSYFPMFIELNDEDCLVVGGGRIALHKVKVLKDFGARITVVAARILPELKAAEDIEFQERRFAPEDVEGRRLVIAATDDKEQNHRISMICKKKHIPVNAVDQTEDCSFIFPAYLKENEVVAAFSSGGQSPVVTQYLKEQMRSVMSELLGELAMQLGGVRERIRQSVPECERKAVYQAILQKGLKHGEPLSDEDIELLIFCCTRSE